jgi:hypothetical protein
MCWQSYTALATLRLGSPGHKNQGRANQAVEQTRDHVLRYGEVVGCELLNFFVRS